MPVADGPTVLGMIRHESQLQTLPVMFLTAKSDKESVMKVLDLNPNKYLLKTMPPDELVAEIDKFFREQKYKKTL
jgi:DNA-binding response OmpR family regulator